MKSPACNDDEVGIRRSVVALVSSTPSDHCAAGDTTNCQATKRCGVLLVETSDTTEGVHSSRREYYGPSRSRERELSSTRPGVFIPP